MNARQMVNDDGYSSFRILADTLPQLVIYIDDREICRAHNIAVENVLGLSAEQIDQRSLREVAGGASYECIRNWVVRALAGEQVYLRQVHRTASGQVLSFEARYAPHLAADGRVLGFCAILTPLWMSDDARAQAQSAAQAIEAEADDEDGKAALAQSPVRHDQALRRVTSALQGNRFCLYQQPIVAISPAHHEPRSFEVLLRLRDEDHRLIHPAAFLQEAEEAGCMVELDRWVIDRLVTWYAKERASSGEPLRFHVNLSLSSIRDGSFSADLRQVIEYHKLPAAMLRFEITESDLANHRLEVMSCMQALRILGCGVGLDRFTGVSGAYSALLDLPIDFVKVDGSIVAGMRTDARDRAKMRVIAKIAQTARIGAIAERVEDESTIELLRDLGIGFAQGFGVSMPEPLAG